MSIKNFFKYSCRQISVITSSFKKKLALLDEHTLEVVKKSSASVLVKIGGLTAALTISIILGRTIGPEGLGIINLVNKLVGILVIIALLGMNNVVLKEIAIGYERKNWQHIADSIYTALSITIPLALVLSLMFILITPWLTNDFFDEPRLKAPFIIASAVMIFQVFSKTLTSGVNGFRKVWQSNLLNESLSFLIIALGLVLLLLFNIEITIINVVILYAIGRVSVFLVVSLYWKHLFRFSGKVQSKSKKMLKVALPLLIVSSTNIIAANADTIMLGWLSSSREVGFYSVAAQLGLLTNFFLAISISSLSPKIASLFADNKKKELEIMIQQVTKGLFFLGIGTILIYFLSGKYILNLWGDEFIASYWVLIIITAGQFFNISTGSTGVFLMMTGHEKVIGNITLISVITNLILNYSLIPYYGAIGAAFATAITVTLENIIKVIVVKKKTGVMTVPFLNKTT